ncbi:hypothetical protein JY651_20945 [Pyxidicoccus parkwayensis]|jgi:hypothetical protein|uniref:Uncharacterized protein n=1 Tax=Pyxidicoccus parkwayensis TaxID=2813578 RepID=A0ABX7P9S8_9BACT|nr:hypothetical protein [Pyxidicoccus parkwaysis]QSQ27226.1 hypothetical protein JY651_20945 [Pyxidicoccus parkwaysis]
MTEPKPRPASKNDLPPLAGRVAFLAVASGLTPLIPVPFLDDYALSQVREGMVRQILGEHGLPTPDKAVAVLAGSNVSASLVGHVKGFLKSVVLLPMQWVFRKVFFVLWVKDCVDMASTSLHHGFLLTHAVERGDLDAKALSSGDMPKRIYDAMVAACAEVDARPINQILRRLFASSRLLMAEATRAFFNPKQTGPRTPDAAESAEVKSLTDRLLAELWEERGYFAVLRQHYDKHLAAGTAASGSRS